MTSNSAGQVADEGRSLLGDQYQSFINEIATLDPELADHVDGFGFAQLLGRSELSPRDRALGLAAALAGDGQASQLLERQLRGALDVGCTPTEVREIIWPLYLYGGLAALERCRPSFLSVLGHHPDSARRGVLQAEELLHERGLARGSLLHGDVYQQRRARMLAIDPQLSDFEVRYGYGHAYMRTQLNMRDRALVTISVQLGLRLTDQLHRHLAAARRAGLSRVEIRELCAQTILYLGWPVGNGGVLLLEQALADAGLSD